MSTSTLQPSAHHPLGPSQWPMLAECIDFQSPPDDSVDLEEQDDDQKDDTPKGRGRVKHVAAATLLVGDLAQRQTALEGLSDREREEVQWAVAKVLEVVESHGYTREDIRVEQRVTMLKPDSFEPLYFGTCDVECGPLDFDFKFGIERKYFTQLVGYALPKMENRGERRRLGFIVYGKLKRMESYVLNIDTVRTVAYGLLARRESSHRKPTLCQYCGWCAKKLTCPALVVTPVTLVERREDWALKLPSPHVSQLHDPAWLGAARFIWKTYLEPWGKAVEFSSSSLPMGIAPVGYFVRPEKGRTKITDTKKAFDALKDVVGEDVLWSHLEFAIGSLSKAYHEASGMSEAKARGVIERALSEAKLLEVGPPGSKLIKEKDAEALIRAALSLDRVPQIPEKRIDPSEAVIDVSTAPEGARA